VSATGASTTSSSFTATTVPQAPTIGTFTDGGTGTTGTLSFTAGANGGSAITGNTYSTDGTNYSAASGTTSPFSLTGLTAGTYTFYLKATNANGTSAASTGVSGTVITPNSFESIATVTGQSGQTFTFSDIPQTFKHLQLRAISRVSLGSYTFSGYTMRVGNGSVDTGNNYSNHRIYTTGNNSIGADASSDASSMDGPFFTANNAIANNVAVTVLDILDYSNTNKYKTMRMLSAFDNNDTGVSGIGSNSVALIQYSSAAWRSTSAINTISFSMGGNATNSVQHFALYGIKG
jgi:hypothetical protein